MLLDELCDIMRKDRNTHFATCGVESTLAIPVASRGQSQVKKFKGKRSLVAGELSKYWVVGFNTWLQVTGLLLGKRKKRKKKYDDLGLFAVNGVYHMTVRVRI